VNREVTSRDVERFRSAIARGMGLAFDDAKLDFLGRVLERRLASTRKTAKAYTTALETRGTRADLAELAELAQELTVPETYFFRHFDQFRAFTEVALPDRLARRSPLEKLAVLCAGCASGEEAYSLAMLLHDRFAEHRGRITIHAIDLNPKVLDRAARARYTSWALRETPEELRRRWFRTVGREFAVDEAVRASVRFERVNLMAAPLEVLRDETYDVVFFRNVVMYFTPDAARAVVDRLSRCLPPGGYLFLGHAETLRGLSVDFDLRHSHETFYYQKRDANERPGMELAPSDRAPKEALFGHDTTSWIETIQSSSQRVEWLAREQPTPARARRKPKGHLQAALALLRDERFGDALTLLDELPSEVALDPEVLLLRASLLAHRGELLLAESVCSELLSVDDLSAGAHYLLALCREGRGDFASAGDHDRMAAYLDDAFAMPRLHLGLMARRAGDRDTARRELARAVELLAREEATRLLLFGGGFSREGLIRLCESELARIGGEQ
jgi:chemotaxis protein methyltransferase CheR